MRLATLETAGGVKVVGVAGEQHDQYIDLHQADPTLPTCPKALLALSDGLSRAATALEAGVKAGATITGNLLAPIPTPGKVICIGLNYRDHAIESGAAIPTEPICFSKFSSCVVPPETEILLPKVAHQVDYEAELVVVIGKRGRNISKANAMQHVAGYTNGNDVSARDWQLGHPGGQWLLGKTPDTFAPIGPVLLTADEVPDPNALRVQFRLNGETMQDSSTKELIFKIDEIIVHLSQLMTLEPGDIIFTGTPPGVGMARKPPIFLKQGDVCEVEIGDFGVLRNPCIQEA